MSERDDASAAEDPLTDDAGASRESGVAGGPDDETGVDAESASPAARVVQLEREVARLREEYAAVQRTRYRRLALGFAAIGVAALVGAAALPPVRTVLVALGGTGLFGAVMTYYLTPEQFVPVDVSERITADLASNQADLVAELDLQPDRVYVPRPDRPVATLFVPRAPDYELPSGDALDQVLVVSENPAARGLAFTPAGNALFVEFEQLLDAPLAADADRLCDQLCEGLTDGIELVDRAETTVDAASDRVTVRLDGSLYGGPERFDHPALSFLAVGLARGLDTPVVMAPKTADEAGTLRATYTAHGGLPDPTADAETTATTTVSPDP